MTPDQFFAKFALLSETPNAVAKMRELILDLALSGRLCDGEIASLQHKRIPLEKVASFINGDRGKNYPSAVHRTTDGVPFVNAGHLKNGDICTEDMDYISEERFELLGGGKFQLGDVIYCLRGSLGKCAVVRHLPRGAIASSLLIMRPHDDVLAEFLYYFLVSPSGIRMIKKYDNGSAQPNLSATNVKKFLLPLPPLAEQKRIVAKVDELMALCDQLESQQKQRETKKATLVQAALTRFTDAPTPSNLEFLFHKSYAIDPAELRKTILTLAVTGRIVTQDYTDESAHDMLLRMSLSNGVDDGVRNKFLDVDLPQNWTKILFEEVAQIASGVTLGRKLGDRRTVTLPYLRVANVKRGEIDISDVKTVAIGEDEIERFALRAGDLLMIEGGDWDKVGRAAIWRGEIPNCLHQNHVFRVRMRTSELLPVWFERYINSPIGRRYFENAAKQTTNLASINMRQVRACPIPLPPLAEQKRIVAKVEELMSLV